MRGLPTACLLLATFAGAAQAYEFTKSRAGAPTRWAEREVTYGLDARPPADVPADVAEAAVHAAFDAWEGAPGAPLRFRYEGYVGDDGGMGRNVVRWTRGDWELEETLAFTQIVFEVDTGHIHDADIYVDEVGHGWDADDGFTYDLQSTLTHEVGHLLGLDHSDEHRATMASTVLPGDRSKRSLAADDVEGLRALYGVSPVVARPSAGGAPDVEERVVASACAATPSNGTTAGWLGLVALALASRRRHAVPVIRRWRGGRR